MEKLDYTFVLLTLFRFLCGQLTFKFCKWSKNLGRVFVSCVVLE